MKILFFSEVFNFETNKRIFLMTKLLHKNKRKSLMHLLEVLLTEKIAELHKISKQIKNLRTEVGDVNLVYVPTMLTQISLNFLPDNLSIFQDNKEDPDVVSLFNIACELLGAEGNGVEGLEQFMKENGVSSLSGGVNRIAVFGKYRREYD